MLRLGRAAANLMPGELSDLNHVARFRQRQEVHAADRPSGLLYHCDRAQLASRRDLSHLTFRQHDNIPKTIQQCRYPGLITFLAKENQCICTLRVRGMRGNSQLLKKKKDFSSKSTCISRDHR